MKALIHRPPVEQENRRAASKEGNFVNITALLKGTRSGSDFTERPTKSFCRLRAHRVFLTAHSSASAAEFHFQMSKAPFRKHTSQPFAYKTSTALSAPLEERTFSDLFTKGQSYRTSQGH